MARFLGTLGQLRVFVKTCGAFRMFFGSGFKTRDVWPTYTAAQSLHSILQTVSLVFSFFCTSFGLLRKEPTMRTGLCQSQSHFDVVLV